MGRVELGPVVSSSASGASDMAGPVPGDGMERSRRSLTSAAGTTPSNRVSPSGVSSKGRGSSSCSSWISPTISSIRSSSVRSPAVPPYSSSTMAISIRRWRMSWICCSTGFETGTKVGTRMTSRSGAPPASWAFQRSRAGSNRASRAAPPPVCRWPVRPRYGFSFRGNLTVNGQLTLVSCGPGQRTDRESNGLPEPRTAESRDTTKAPRVTTWGASVSSSRGGTRTPNARIMIPP
jgi:hypothetical protein